MATRLVVEWTRASMRIAVAEGSDGGAKVREIRSQPIPSAAEPGQVLRLLLGKHPPVNAQVISVLPREQVITRVVKFPTVQSAELSQMVELYAKAQLPYPKEQAVFDFHLVSQQAGFSTVAIVACQREVVDRQVSVLRAAGLSPGLMTVSSWGVLGWYSETKPKAQEPCLVVNVDDTRTDLVLIAQERVLSSRSIGQGAHEWALLGNVAELLALEVERSRGAIRKELPGTDVRSILLTGMDASSARGEQMAQRVGLPVQVVDGIQAFKGVVAHATPAISPVVIGGLASAETRGLLNLSPQDVRLNIRHVAEVRDLVKVGVLLLIVLVLGSLLIGLQISQAQRTAIKLDQALAAAEPTAERLQQYSRASTVVGTVFRERRHLGTMLAQVFRTTPASIALEVVSFEQNKPEFTVRGHGASTQVVLEYVAQLQQLPLVESVQLKYSTKRATADGERTDFELVMQQHEPT